MANGVILKKAFSDFRPLGRWMIRHPLASGIWLTVTCLVLSIGLFALLNMVAHPNAIGLLVAVVYSPYSGLILYLKCRKLARVGNLSGDDL